MGSPYVMDYRGSFSLPAPPGDVWSAIGQVDQFEQWWVWLSEFRLEAPPLGRGAVLHGVVSPPLPYRMRLRIELETWDPPRLIEARVGGDLRGQARIVLEPGTGGTVAGVEWSLEMMQLPMRLAARVGKPLLRWGHDRVVEITVAGFVRRLAGRSAASEPGLDPGSE
jgi:carbon monoxide dehydrogenase subunit G